MTVLTLIGKPDCHLCDVAEGVIERVLADLPDGVADRVEVVERSILEDTSLYERWWEKIPVVLVDGELHAHWRVASDRLRDALIAADDRTKERAG
ncbi:MAG: thioredoxin family protein [Microbacterium sp.]|uniref:glutaredoxin family protein n=1 Tax=unclassified Microbacterium TaxID=2609290 RepID=UPI000DB76B2F|nr:glutaredoxin family protein [Microbacterium sp.]PZU40476.1 MAG: thioredoxin family protein [Microbacterium sp.]